MVHERREPQLLDDFESLDSWSAHPSDGVRMAIVGDSGLHGRGMRVDVDYQGGGGYAIVRRLLPLDLPANYEFTFMVRGTLPPENLEFKLVDSTGDNVWWVNRRDFTFPARWTQVTIKRRQVSFAWGPKGGGELHRMAALEIALTAGSGGKGSAWIDDLALTELEPVTAYRGTPSLTATSALPGHDAARAMDGRAGTSWRSAALDTSSLTIDFGQRREMGGFTVDWDPVAYARDYDVLVSPDGAAWDSVYAVRAASGGRHYVYLPETETRFVRVRVLAAGGAEGVAIREVAVKPLAWSATPNDFWLSVRRDAPHGSFPRYLDSVQTYWTLVGVSGAPQEGLLDTDGRLESDKGAFAIEPFLYAGERLWDWSDVAATPSLEDDALPMPSVRWTGAPLELTVTAFASGTPGASLLHGRYRVTNRSRSRQAGRLYLAIRPFQVNPPWQFLNTSGGFTPIDSIRYDGRVVRVNGVRVVAPITRPSGFGAATMEQGEVTRHLRRGVLPARRSATDARGFASGALAWVIDLAPGETREVDVVLPFAHDGAAHAPAGLDDGAAERWTAAVFDSVRGDWREQLGRVAIELPKSAAPVVRAIRSNLAYILINRDGPAIQPGSRSYERSWIRDGSLTSTALLRLGHAAEVRQYLEWFAPHQYANGKVPCCVDARGADPVPENDSHGELIYAIAEYVRVTGDTAFAARMWPHVTRAVRYMDSLRAERRTDEYLTPEKRAYYGLLPQSISHEGYSAKPMHSFWDDLFALRGYKDATWLAGVVGKRETMALYAAARDTFQANVMDAWRLTMEAHHIDYLAGSVELGDLDPTSTTIALSPVADADELPRPALDRTFDRYVTQIRERRNARLAWKDYTPYEWRTVGALVRLGRPAEAHEILEWLMRGERPPAWNQWAEVVRRDPKAPGFIGDMPHTWVGSDFIRSALDLVAYDASSGEQLVIGAGVPLSWTADSGLTVRGLVTHEGPLDLAMRREGRTVTVHVGGALRVPPGGIVIHAPFDMRATSATIDGASVPVERGAVVVRQVPTDVVFAR